MSTNKSPTTSMSESESLSITVRSSDGSEEETITVADIKKKFGNLLKADLELPKINAESVEELDEKSSSISSSIEEFADTLEAEVKEVEAEVEPDHTDGYGLLEDVLQKDLEQNLDKDMSEDSLLEVCTVLEDFADSNDLEEEFDLEIEQFDDALDLPTGSFSLDCSFSSDQEEKEQENSLAVEEKESEDSLNLTSFDSKLKPFSVYHNDEERDFPDKFTLIPGGVEEITELDDDPENGFWITADNVTEDDEELGVQKESLSPKSLIEKYSQSYCTFPYGGENTSMDNCSCTCKSCVYFNSKITDVKDSVEDEPNDKKDDIKENLETLEVHSSVEGDVSC